MTATREFYYVTTNRNSWGKAAILSEAISNSFLHTEKPVTKMKIYEVSVPEGTKVADVEVTELGWLRGPNGINATLIRDIEDDGAMYSIWKQFSDAVMEVELADS